MLLIYHWHRLRAWLCNFEPQKGEMQLCTESSRSFTRLRKDSLIPHAAAKLHRGGYAPPLAQIVLPHKRATSRALERQSRNLARRIQQLRAQTTLQTLRCTPQRPQAILHRIARITLKGSHVQGKSRRILRKEENGFDSLPPGTLERPLARRLR